MSTPLSDIQPTSPPSDTDSFDDSYIDQSFCSNFSCCGQSLPDLHRLLDHFEDEHVLPISVPYDSRPLYSSSVYARPSAPHASYILSYPQPDPPPRPLPDRHDMTRIPLGPAPDFTYSSPASSCDSPPNRAEPLCLPPALFTFQNPHSRPRTPPLDSDDFDDDKSDDALPVPPPRPRVRAGVGPHRTAKQAHSSVARIPATPVHACAGSRRSRRDGREKAYKCPHPGCMKSYLNPNGLKYHLEKGTCTNANADGRESSFNAIGAAMPAVPSAGDEVGPPSQPSHPLPRPPPESPASDTSLSDSQRQRRQRWTRDAPPRS